MSLLKLVTLALLVSANTLLLGVPASAQSFKFAAINDPAGFNTEARESTYLAKSLDFIKLLLPAGKLSSTYVICRIAPSTDSHILMGPIKRSTFPALLVRS